MCIEAGLRVSGEVLNCGDGRFLFVAVFRGGGPGTPVFRRCYTQMAQQTCSVVLSLAKISKNLVSCSLGIYEVLTVRTRTFLPKLKA